MSYTMFAISAYIFMRAFAEATPDFRNKSWHKIISILIAVLVLYSAVAALLTFYVAVPLLGFDPKS